MRDCSNVASFEGSLSKWNLIHCLAFRLAEDFRFVKDRVPGGIDPGRESDLTQRLNLLYYPLLVTQSSSHIILLM